MIDILLWVLLLTVIEGGVVFLAAYLWNLGDRLNDEAKEIWCFGGFIFAVTVAILVGIMLAASGILGTILVFKMYG